MRPKFFAVFDLTSGYFQCPISQDSRKYTTFTTPFGNYQWTRLPMGPSNAPAHFQNQMVTKVFWQEIHKFLEIYLDDLIVWGQTEEEFMHNLQVVFTRLTQYNLTLNPDKCTIGVSSVEYLGHVIDAAGLRFTPKKLESVVNFKTPETQREMKSFLGLCTYFREHVPNFASLAATLYKSISSPYRPTRPFHWTPDLTATFHTLKTAVYACETLYFPQDKGQFIVETDASKFGIGAALFQEVPDPSGEGGLKRIPIGFMSQSMNPTQQRWSTFELEGYAIFVALNHWRHFLEDVHFILKTDHKNLRFINTNGQDKVRRWKIVLQDFNFDIEWIAGDENFVADILSRQFALNAAHAYFTGPINFGGEVRDANAHSVITEFHQATVGHFATDTTLARLRARGVSWPNMENDVEAFIRNCPSCQKLSEKSFPITSNHYSSAAYSPMLRLNVDTIGPYTKDSFGNAYVIVVIDTFTRFVELYKAPDATAVSAARALLDHIGRYGVPVEILTDNGPQYYNDIMDHLSHRLGVTQLFTVPYSHQENGIVERANKEVSRHLRAIILDHRVMDTWSDSLPLVQRIINSKIHETTGVAPATLLFGNMIDLDRVLLPPPPLLEDVSAPPSSIPEYIQKLNDVQQAIIDKASTAQKAHDDIQRSRKRGRVATEFATNDLVLMEHPDGKRPHKLLPRLTGPYRVTGSVPSVDGTTPAEYVLMDLTSQTTLRAGIHRLRPFHHDPVYSDPSDSALTDKDAYSIDSIVDHKPKIAKHKFLKLPKGSLQFLVKYSGFDVPEWNSWSNLRTTVQLHEYLRQHGLAAMIPNNFLDTSVRP